MIDSLSRVGLSGVNGDIIYVSEDQTTLLLSDGASGAGDDGKKVMAKLCRDTAVNFPYKTSGLKPEQYLDQLIHTINKQLIEISQIKDKLHFGTIAVAVIDDRQVTASTLGDSPIYFAHEATVEELARTPRKYEWMIEQGFFDKEAYEGYISHMHPMLWSSFNQFIPMIIPCHKIETRTISEGDILVLCCDGISDWFEKEELIECIKQEKLEAICDIAKQRSLEFNEYMDDQSIIVAKF